MNKIIIPMAVVVGVAIASCSTGTTANQTATPSVVSVAQPSKALMGYADIAEKVLPSVVNLDVFDDSGQGGSGSGFIISEDGYIVTNHHVAAAFGDAEIFVTFSDESVVEGTLVGSDAGYDIAVVKVDITGLPTLPLEKPTAKVRVGDVAVALGSPLGLQGTVTAGIVSALNRPVIAGDFGGAAYINAVQTDAAINPGNSGGPLVNNLGQLIGVNSAIASTGDVAGSIGLGFAIPVKTAMRIANEIIKTGSSSTPVIGVSLDESFFGPGAKIAEVTAGSSAKKAGLKVGDIITSVNGNIIADSVEVIVSIRANAPGDTIKIKVDRGNKSKSFNLVLGSA